MSSTTATISASKVAINADDIRLKSSKLAWSSTYSSMSSDGKLICSDATIAGGSVTTKSGSDYAKLSSGRIQFGKSGSYGSYITTGSNYRNMIISANTVYFDVSSIGFFDGMVQLSEKGYSGTKNGLKFYKGFCVGTA